MFLKKCTCRWQVVLQRGFWYGIGKPVVVCQDVLTVSHDGRSICHITFVFPDTRCCQTYVQNVITCPRSGTFLGDLFNRFSSAFFSQCTFVPNGRYCMQFEATILTPMTLLFSDPFVLVLCKLSLHH